MGYLFKRNWWWWLMTCNTDWLSVLVTVNWCCRPVSAQRLAGGWWRLLSWIAQVCPHWAEFRTQLCPTGGLADTAVGHLGFTDKMERRSVDTRSSIEACSECTQATGGRQYGHFSYQSFFLTKCIVHCIKSVQTVVSVKIWFWQIVFTVKMVKFCF